jgi:hypothetical protein
MCIRIGMQKNNDIHVYSVCLHWDEAERGLGKIHKSDDFFNAFYPAIGLFFFIINGLK